MDQSIILGLLQNTAVLIAFSMIYDYLWSRYEKPKTVLMKIMAGLALGVFGIIIIMTPWIFVPGIVFDVRSVLLSISGLFLGPLPTIIAMIMAGVYRFYIGGDGVWMGIAVILSSGTIGMLWRALRPGWQEGKPALELLFLGVIVHAVMLACTMLLPVEMAVTTAKTIIIPLLTVYPLATMLLGLLMIHFQTNLDNKTRLKINEKRFRTIIEKATDAMYLCDFEGNIFDVNEQACKLLGYERSEFLKLNLTDVDLLNNDEQKIKELTEKIIYGETLLIETIHRRKDGSVLPVEITFNIIELNDVLFVIGFARNLTDRKKVEEEIKKLNAELEERVVERTEQLEATNAELEAFSYSVSHDLRAPLRSIDSFTNILIEDYSASLDSEGNRLLKVIKGSTVKMGHLIDDLLAFSRLGRQAILISRIEMYEMAESVYLELTTEEERNGIDFLLHDIPAAYGDPSMVRQVWVNLISNAIKFTSKKINRIIDISSYPENGKNIYCIKDNGAGFDMNYADKLFSVFQRLHTVSEFEGSGVGLAIVRQVLLRMNGKIWAVGKEDEGATFYFALPSRG